MKPALPCVLVSWDGADVPLRMIHRDAEPEFDLVLFDYSGRAAAPEAASLGGLQAQLLSQATECKGEIYQALAAALRSEGRTPEYVALIDDDVMLGVSGINRALHIAHNLGLDSFSPALGHDSAYSHRFTLRRPHRVLHEVDWVEVMMPFYRGELFLAGAPHYAGNVSSWGIDQYLMPTLGKLGGMDKVAVIDAVMASHRRPVTSGGKVFRNGLTALQEKAAMRERSMALVAEQAPQLVGTEWYRRTFLRRHRGTTWQRISSAAARRVARWIDERL